MKYGQVLAYFRYSHYEYANQTKKVYFSQKLTVTRHSLHGKPTGLVRLISFKSVY